MSWKGIELGNDRKEVSHLGGASGEEDPAAGVNTQQRAGGRSTAGEKLCQHLCLFCRHLQQHLHNNVIRAEEKLVLRRRECIEGRTWLYALIRARREVAEDFVVPGALISDAEAQEHRVFFFRILHINEDGIWV